MRQDVLALNWHADDAKTSRAGQASAISGLVAAPLGKGHASARNVYEVIVSVAQRGAGEPCPGVVEMVAWRTIGP